MAQGFITLDAEIAREYELMGRNFPKLANIALSRSLNRAAAHGRTVAVKKTREDYYVKYGALLKKYRIKKSTASTLYAEMTVGDEDETRVGAIPLINFKVSPKRPDKKRPPVGVKVQVKKSGSGGIIPHSFIMNMGGKYSVLQVVERTTADPHPVKVLYSNSVPAMTSSHADYIQKEMEDNLNKRATHEIGQIVSSAGDMAAKKWFKKWVDSMPDYAKE